MARDDRERVRKMKVRMKVSIASADFAYQPGQVVLLDANTATQWILVGHAEKVDPAEPITEAAALQTNDFAVHDPRVYYRMRGHFIEPPKLEPEN